MEYAPQARRKRQPSSSSPSPVAWFLVGLLSGGLGVGLYCLQKPAPAPATTETRSAPATPPANAKPAEPVKPTTPEEAPPKPRFDFYTVLPEMEVAIPEEEIRKPPPKEEPKEEPKLGDATKPGDPNKASEPAKTAKESDSAAVYLLQVGSFRNLQDADRLKATLGFLGVEAEIQSIRIDSSKGNSGYYRVRSGPYNRAQASNINEMLKANQINSIIMRLGK